ncbi:MAG: hypothetical protein LQ351_002105 [Letrouitia transgressa]|nr:MAG: hypothetical protein LQ351_002105 [Letrouitia transgressa]
MRDCQLVARTLRETTNVKRCAFACDGSSIFSIIPLHGLSEAWEPVAHHEKVLYQEVFPGHLTTKSTSVLPDEELGLVQQTITAVTGLKSPLNFEFEGDASDQNLFAKIVRGQTGQWRIWEDKKHVAFLTPFGNTRGFTVLVPRRHLPSDIFALRFEEYRDLNTAAYEVAQHLRKAFDIDRCGIFFEGYEVDYAHVKLVPVHQEDMPGKEFPPKLLNITDFHESYHGFLTTQFGPLVKDTHLLDELVVKYQENGSPNPDYS